MCRLKNFFCCLPLEIGGFFLGWLYFFIHLTGFIGTFAGALIILAKAPSLIVFVISVILLFFFFTGLICAWSLIKGVSFREARKVRRFKCFTCFCLFLKVIALIGVVSVIFQLAKFEDLPKKQRRRLEAFEGYRVELLGLSYGLIASILWEIYVVIISYSIERKFKDEQLPFPNDFFYKM